MKSTLILLLVSAFLYTTTIAQNQLGIMPTLNFNKPVNSKSSFNLFVYDILGGARGISTFTNKQLYAEVAFIHMLSKHVGGTLAYAHQVDFIGKPILRVNENRLFQELFTVHEIGKNKYVNRLRLEQRFFDIPSTKAKSTQTRIRYFFNYIYSCPSGKGFINTYNDIFYVGNSNSKLNENWLYAAYGIKLPKQASIELGVLWQNFETGVKQRGNQYLAQVTLNKKF